MSKRSERAYLGDMLDFARRAHAKVAAVTLEQWDGDENLRLAVSYLLQTIGEAASRVSDTTRRSFPEFPWERIVGMRHHLVHGYGDVRPEIVWQVATVDLPPLIAVLESRLAES